MKALLFPIAALLFALPAQAQTVCTMRTDLIKMLTDKYLEQPIGQGLVGERAMLEVYVSEKGTFTVVSSFPNGVACIIAAGNNWQVMKPERGTKT